jgi:glycosyltransferase involved in cell wall biosynthesis
MAHGRPVVATAVGGLLDAVEDGVTGVLVEPGDPSALRRAIADLLADEARRDALGRAALLRATALFARAPVSGLRRAYDAASTPRRSGSGGACAVLGARRAR